MIPPGRPPATAGGIQAHNTSFRRSRTWRGCHPRPGSASRRRPPVLRDHLPVRLLLHTGGEQGKIGAQGGRDADGVACRRGKTQGRGEYLRSIGFPQRERRFEVQPVDLRGKPRIDLAPHHIRPHAALRRGSASGRGRRSCSRAHEAARRSCSASTMAFLVQPRAKHPASARSKRHASLPAAGLVGRGSA